MANIFCRSPYIVNVNSTGQLGSKVELRIWNGTGSAPTSPTYTLSKPIPSASNINTIYNVSPYIQEFISHDLFNNEYYSAEDIIPTNQWCNVQIKRYKYVGGGIYTLVGTTTHKAFKGYGYYTDGYNEDLGDILLDEGTYEYYYDPFADLDAEPLKRYGTITWIGRENYGVRYTDLVTGTTFSSDILQNTVIETPRVYYEYYANGNKLEILNASDVVIFTAYFKPKTECKYTPVTIDFVNKYGAWQREFFFKASKNTISKTNTTYNLLQNNLINYDVLEGQRKVFNTVMLETIQVNSDWRDDSYGEVIRQLFMSERILLNNSPVKLTSNSAEMFKQINTKMINYQLDFEYSYDINNTVV